ncbi:hypothetical protein [Embleya sp. NPDC059237]|uniref:hypothetical protein n=1 Tax=Embleya sp. NPDC059237 TaxID=3346784 RepID=UPI0036888B3F
MTNLEDIPATRYPSRRGRRHPGPDAGGYARTVHPARLRRHHDGCRRGRGRVPVQTLYFTFATKHTIPTALLDVPVAGATEPGWPSRRHRGRPQGAAAAGGLALGGPIREVVRSAAAVDRGRAGLRRANVAQRHAIQLRLAEPPADGLRGIFKPGSPLSSG